MNIELTKEAQEIKVQLASDLAKTGRTLWDFEEGLANINTGEGVYKAAAAQAEVMAPTSYMQTHVGPMFSGMSEFALKGSMAGGALSGLTLDEMDNSVDDVNKALEKEREKVKLVRRITENLKREHGLH